MSPNADVPIGRGCRLLEDAFLSCCALANFSELRKVAAQLPRGVAATSSGSHSAAPLFTRGSCRPHSAPSDAFLDEITF